MKKIIFYSLLFVSGIANAQKNYDAVDSYIKEAISTFKENTKEVQFLKIVKNNFDKAPKMELSEFKKNNLGIAFVFSNETVNPEIVPAKFSFENEKINISAINSNPELMQDYVQKYLYEMEKLGQTQIFKKILLSDLDKEGTYHLNKSEIYVSEPLSDSFVRGTKDWMYIVSIDSQFKIDPSPRIIIYAFKISLSGEDIFKAGNEIEKIEERRQQSVASKKTDSEIFPLYHDIRTKEIKDGLARIIMIEPFKSNENLIENYNSIDEKITRYSIHNYIDEFKFFLSVSIPKEFLEKKFERYDDEEVFSIQHLSAHALADFYFGKEEYENAIEYYKKSIFEFPYEELSGTNVVRDAERIMYDIAKSNYKAEKKDEAYGFLIGLIIDSQQNYDLATKTINEYMDAEKEDRKKIKKDIDKALKTIKKGDNYTYSFRFREKEIFFFPMLPVSQQHYEKNFKESEFYKSL